MDTGSKSLAQLAEEGKEKKYVTLDVGSKVSGYTRDYLERLCRLRKVEYLLRENDEHAIELESLLRETHTILLSYEGVDFVDRSTLRKESAGDASSSPKQTETTDDGATPSRPEFVKQVPRFGESHDLNARLSADNPFAYVGRSVISDGTSPDPSSKKEVRVPVGITNESSSPKEISSPESLLLKEVPPPPPPPPPPTPSMLAPATDSLRPESSHPSLHLSISDLDQEEELVVHAHQEDDVPENTQEPHNADRATVLPSSPETVAPLDEWDSLLFGGEKVVHDTSPVSSVSEIPAVILPETAPSSAGPVSNEAFVPEQEYAPFLPLADRPSVYRPIKTSVDASVHHDDAPLLPPLSKETLPPRAPTRVSTFVPPSGQKVVVFDPKGGVKLPPQFEKRRIDPLISPSPKPGSEAIPKAPERMMNAQDDQTVANDSDPLAPSVTSSGSTSLSASLPTRTPSPLHVDGRLPSPFSPSSSIGNTLSHELVSREAHELLPYVDHSLAPRGSFGMIVSGALGIVGMVVFGGVLLGNLGVDLNSTLYVASVGSEAGNRGDLEFPEKEEGSYLKGFFELLNSRHESAPLEAPPESLQSTSTPEIAEE